MFDYIYQHFVLYSRQVYIWLFSWHLLETLRCLEVPGKYIRPTPANESVWITSRNRFDQRRNNKGEPDVDTWEPFVRQRDSRLYLLGSLLWKAFQLPEDMHLQQLGYFPIICNAWLPPERHDDTKHSLHWDRLYGSNPQMQPGCVTEQQPRRWAMACSKTISSADRAAFNSGYIYFSHRTLLTINTLK